LNKQSKKFLYDLSQNTTAKINVLSTLEFPSKLIAITKAIEQAYQLGLKDGRDIKPKKLL
jgi:hypothetical protein